MKTIYLAGGCFWGLEKLMLSLPGIVNAESGYANGASDIVPTYDRVCLGDTGYRETVKVVYDSAQISLDLLLFAYFQVVDVTVSNRQGNDWGTQYQAGIYYEDEASGKVVKEAAAQETAKHSSFRVEIKPLERYFPAEEYHQRYLEKHPRGYCHIAPHKIDRVVAAVRERMEAERTSPTECNEPK